MPTIRIDDLPDETLAVLERHAERSGQSLEDYLREAFVSLAARYRAEDASGLSADSQI